MLIFKILELDNLASNSNKMDQILYTTNMYFTRIDKKLDLIIDYIKGNPNSNVRSCLSLDSTFLSLFPMKDLESLISLNDLLQDDDNIIKLVYMKYLVLGIIRV